MGNFESMEINAISRRTIISKLDFGQLGRKKKLRKSRAKVLSAALDYYSTMFDNDKRENDTV